MSVNIPKLALAQAICFSAAFGGSLFTPQQNSEWYYQILQKPAWNPPDWLFGPAWALFFLLMGFALYQVLEKGANKPALRPALVAFGIQLVLNFCWSALFFGLHSPLFALVDIVLLWLAILFTIIKFKPISPLASNLLIPYILWVSFASVLTFTIWQMN
uniref:CrtK protein n=1 Tax=Chlorobium chlorochromatii (strain CaD3) TaxID=340177 RepID=Q3AU89_CHLCH